MVSLAERQERVAAPSDGEPGPRSSSGRSAADAWRIAAAVPDPEVPVLTIEDLGVLRDVAVDGDRVTVTITPTYSGCPAVDAIRDDVVLALTAAGFAEVDVRLTLTPAWTTDWMSDAGKDKLRAYGIAPPTGRAAAGPTRPEAPPGASAPRGGGVGTGPIRLALAVKCPRCGSLDTRELARFGSTSCKALYECRACLEPFDHFKVH
jgi:ring-1,2-phenylacetyl-CoA epoxidase subunit PaaD